jgi:hypothetical protein
LNLVKGIKCHVSDLLHDSFRFKMSFKNRNYFRDRQS